MRNRNRAAGPDPDRLRICLLSYRCNPHSGGQGVYIRNLSRALRDLGHGVDVVAGPPHLDLDDGIRRIPVPGLDLYNPADLFRIPTARELTDPINVLEWWGVSTMGFPEPFTFGLRAYRLLRRRVGGYHVLHDNQSLSYGLWALSREVPMVATIHHPITVDRRYAARAVRPLWRKLQQWRWYSFIGMQKRVARCLYPIITVSGCARGDICREFRVPAANTRVVPNGIDTDLFRPLDGVDREPGRIIVTNSADMPLKGLAHLLHGVAEVLHGRRGPLRLVVIGNPNADGAVIRLVRRLGIAEAVQFTGRVSNTELVRQYARASVAVVPSVYEGFGLPAGEAMACGVPVISTTGGALPEVVGDAGILVPAADPPALAAAIRSVLNHPPYGHELGRRGLQRVRRHFTWRRAAEGTVSAYREAIDDHRRLRTR